MTKEQLADAIQGFLTDVQHGNSSCRLDVKDVTRMDLKYTNGEPVLSVTDGDDLMFFVEVNDA